jgi:hypothetical protein
MTASTLDKKRTIVHFGAVNIGEAAGPALR